MTPSDRTPRRWGLSVLAIALSLAGGVLLLIAMLIFTFYAYCEDSCDSPPWSFWSALRWAALPGAPAVATLSAAAYLWMRRQPPVRAAWARALAVGLVASVVFVAGAAGLVWLVVLGASGTVAWMLAALAVLGWIALTAVAARRIGRGRGLG